MDIKKYIVETDDETQLLVEIGVNSTGAALIATNPVSFLTPYTEPDLDAVKKEVYDKCMSEAEDLAYKLYSPKIDEAYQRGLNDAWDAARKIVLSREDGGLFSYEERKAVFGCGNYMALKNYSASEAIEKIRQYEQEQEDFKVGDEVINDEDVRGVAVDMDDYLLHVLDENGVIQAWPREDVVKTGRHFPEIVEVLKKMQEEKE